MLDTSSHQWQLTAGLVRLAVSSVGLSGRTMWRWLGRGPSTGQVTPPGRARFVGGGLAYWRGTAAAELSHRAPGGRAGPVAWGARRAL